MALSNYTELLAAVRTELDISTSGISDAAIADAVTRAEAKINRRGRFREGEQLSYATYSSGSRYLALPSGFVELLNLRIKVATAADTTYVPVNYVDPQRIHEYYDTASDQTFYYTLRDQIELSHEPVSDHRVMMHYLKKWDIATDSTNWLLTNYPDIYLYGSLVECEAHVRDDQRIPVWKSLFDQGIRDLNKLSERNRDDAELSTAQVAGMSNRSLFNILTG